MSPKEKAVELTEFYKDYVRAEWVIIVTERCIDEIMKHNPNLPNEYSCTKSYWIQVKQELNKL